MKKSLITGTAEELEELKDSLQGEKEKEYNGDSRAYTEVIIIGNKRYRFFIDHRNNTGTVKVKPA